MAAAQRLDAQRAYYEEGRMTIDRYLHAIGRYTTAVATESQYLMTYNISIVALEEAKGTLLDGIVAEVPGDRAPVESVSEKRVADTAERPKASPEAKPTPAPKKSEPSATTYSFRFTIGRGPEPMEIRGSITVSPGRDEAAWPPVAIEPEKR